MISTPLFLDIPLALILIFFAKWNSFEFNYTEKAISFLYFALLCLKTISFFLPLETLELICVLLKLYIEQFIVCSFLHRIISPFAYILCEIFSIIANIFICIILTLYVLFSFLRMHEYFNMLISFYAFLISFNATFAVIWHFVLVFKPKKSPVRVSPYHIEKRTKNIKLLIFYCLIEYLGLLCLGYCRVNSDYCKLWTLLHEYGFMTLTILILVYERHRRRNFAEHNTP